MSDATPPPPPDNPYGSGSGQPPPPNQPPPAQGYGAAHPPAGQQGFAGGPPQYGAVGPRPGELLDRFLARLIDNILLVVVTLIIVVPLLFTMLGLNGGGFGMGGGFAAGAVSAVVSTVIYLGYFGFMESSRGQTVGKMLMKLHVQGANGGKPTFEQAVKRNIWMGLPLLGVVPILGGLIGSLLQLVAVIMIAVGINNDPARRQPWTDKFADTQVIKEG